MPGDFAYGAFRILTTLKVYHINLKDGVLLMVMKGEKISYINKSHY